MALIDDLPNELLQQLFTESKQLESRDAPWSWRMAHVSQRWRRQIFSTQLFWERPVAFRRATKLSRFRAESSLFAPAPLEMKLELLQCDLPSAREAMSVVADQFHRLVALHLRLAAAQFDGRCMDVILSDVTLPQLTTLSISVTNTTAFFLGLHCPMLQDLSLDMIKPSNWDLLVSGHLTHLSLANIRFESSDFRRILELGQNITSMALRNFGFLDAPEPFELPLARLETLTISDTYSFILTMLYKILRVRNVREVSAWAKFSGPNDFARYLRVDDLPYVHSLTVDPWKLCIANSAGAVRRCTYLSEDMLVHLARQHQLANTLGELDIAVSMWVPLARALAADAHVLPHLERLVARIDHVGRIRGRELVQSTLSSDVSPFIRCPRLRHFVLDGAPNTGWEQPGGALIAQFVLALRSDELESVTVRDIALAREDAVALEVLQNDFGVHVNYKLQAVGACES